MRDDPCDEWPVVIADDKLWYPKVEDRTWLRGGEGYIVSWRRIDENEGGDTVYRCIVLYPIG